MILKLQTTEDLVAEADIRCDAREVIFDLAKFIDKSDKLKHQRFTITMVYAKNRTIKKGMNYLRLTFLDIESGELLDFNCNKENHDSCVSLKLYPEIILKALN
jgi:hypothetical protein